MLRIRLISFLILLSIVSLQAKEDAKAQKYFCRSNEDLAELDNSKIERLLIDKDVVYLFLPKKVLRFSMPYIFNTFKTVLANKTFTIIRPLNQTTQLNDTQPLAQLSNKTEPKGVKPFNPPMHLNDTKSVQHVIPENQTETVNITRTVQLTVIDETFVVSSQAFVLAGKGAAASENLIGYVSDNTADDKSLLFEFYRVTDSEPKYHSLKFDPKPGESDTEGDKRLNSKKVDPGPLSYLMDYYYYFQFNNNAIRVGLIYYKDGSTFAEITNFSGSVKKKSTKKSIRRGNETIRFAVYYEAPVKKPMELENSLVEVDTENFIHIHLTAFRNGQTQMHSSFKLSQFFGCHSKFERKDQVKGVLYDQKFYLFVNHHYLKFDDDLVELRFKIENKSYENGTDLDLGENFRFENYRTKWVRSFLSTAYLSILDQTFKIWVDQASGNLQFDSIKEQTLKGIMQNCTRQLLNVDQYVFCFEEKNYYPAGYLDSVPVGRSGNHSDLFLKRPIIELFKGGRVSYESNETLEFIFNYKANKFVLLTQMHLFIVPYSGVRVDAGPTLVFPSDNIVKKEHYLYRNIDMSQDPVARVPTTSGDENRPTKFDTTKLMILIVLAVIATVLLLMHLIYKKFTKKKRPKKSGLLKLDSNKGVKTDSRSAKSSINFSKLMDQSRIPKVSSNQKDGSESARYNKETSGKETTTNLPQFLNEMPKNGEKSKSSKVLYINSQTGQAKMKDQKSNAAPSAEAAKVAVKSGLNAKSGLNVKSGLNFKSGLNAMNAAERAMSLPKSGAVLKEASRQSRKGSGAALLKEPSWPGKKDSGALLKEASRQSRKGSGAALLKEPSGPGKKDSGALLKEASRQSRKGSGAALLKEPSGPGKKDSGALLKEASRQSRKGSGAALLKEPSGQNRKSGGAALLRGSNGQSKTGSNLGNDSRLLRIESSNFDSETKDGSLGNKASTQTRRGSAQSGKGNPPGRRGSTPGGKGSTPSRGESTPGRAGNR